MDHCWDDSRMSLNRTVDTHIKTIRGKLEKIDPTTDPKTVLKTNIGIGFSLNE
jgi:two-component system catabolic regulation response regulator CreB